MNHNHETKLMLIRKKDKKGTNGNIHDNKNKIRWQAKRRWTRIIKWSWTIRHAAFRSPFVACLKVRLTLLLQREWGSTWREHKQPAPCRDLRPSGTRGGACQCHMQGNQRLDMDLDFVCWLKGGNWDVSLSKQYSCYGHSNIAVCVGSTSSYTLHCSILHCLVIFCWYTCV